MTVFHDGFLKPRELRCQGHEETFATFTDTMGGTVVVTVLGHKALISREEIAALAALFPVLPKDPR